MIKSTLITLISTWCAIEFIVSPYPFYGKENGVFPTILLGPFSFDLSEIFIYTFIGFNIIALVIKFLYSQKISLGYGYNKYLVLWFSIPLIASIFLGYVNRGPEFMTMLRVQIVLLLFLVFMNLYDVRRVINNTIRLVYFVGIANAMIFLLSLLKIDLWRVTIYPDLFSYYQYMWFGLYFSVFSYAVLINKVLIYSKSSLADYILIAMLIVVVFVNITSKPIFLATVIVTFTTFLVFFKANIRRLRIVVIGLMVFSSSVFIYLNLDEQQKDQYINTVSQRFLKQEAHTWNEVFSNLEQVSASGGKDFSAGRFELWKSYLAKSIHSPIVSTNYGYKKRTILSSMSDRDVDMPAHNSIVHYTYYAGYIAGVSLLLIILYFFKATFNFNKRTEYFKIVKKYKIKEHQFHGMLAFLYAVIVNELIGGPLTNVKFSWFWWIMVVFVLKIISEYRDERKCINSQL